MAFGTFTELAYVTVDADFEAFQESGVAAVIVLNPRETVSLRFAVDADGTTDDIIIQVLQGHRINNGKDLASATDASNVELDATDGIAIDDDEIGTYFAMTSGGEAGELRLVTDSASSDDGIVLDHALSGTPSAAETYARYNLKPFLIKMDLSAAVDEDNTHNKGITVDAVNGQYVLVSVKATGVTDAHRIRMSYQVDGVSI